MGTIAIDCADDISPTMCVAALTQLTPSPVPMLTRSRKAANEAKWVAWLNAVIGASMNELNIAIDRHYEHTRWHAMQIEILKENRAIITRFDTDNQDDCDHIEALATCFANRR